MTWKSSYTKGHKVTDFPTGQQCEEIETRTGKLCRKTYDQHKDSCYLSITYYTHIWDRTPDLQRKEIARTST